MTLLERGMSRPFVIVLLTFLALTAFAANSILGRLAFIENDIGPWGYTLIRLTSGAVVLLCLVGFKQSRTYGSWSGAMALLIYGIFFSYAYLLLSAGTGALILFAVVQLTMLGYGFFIGERLSRAQWIGFILAVIGLLYLLAPRLEAPSLLGAVLMTASGIGWGVYSILGKVAGSPTAQTAGNFCRAALILGGLSVPTLWMLPEPLPTPTGWGLAITSGAITSALGYVVWYRVLKDISVTTAGISQLSVPVFTAFGGIIFISETLSLHFIISSVLILSGVCLSTLANRPHTRNN